MLKVSLYTTLAFIITAPIAFLPLSAIELFSRSVGLGEIVDLVFMAMLCSPMVLLFSLVGLSPVYFYARRQWLDVLLIVNSVCLAGIVLVIMEGVATGGIKQLWQAALLFYICPIIWTATLFHCIYRRL